LKPQVSLASFNLCPISFRMSMFAYTSTQTLPSL
jgi:hypothetical protein